MRSLLHASHVGTFFIVYAPRMMSAAKNVMIKNLVNLTNRKPKQGEKTMFLLTKEEAEKILNYLNTKGMAFCWLENGRLIAREDCLKVINS